MTELSSIGMLVLVGFLSAFICFVFYIAGGESRPVDENTKTLAARAALIVALLTLVSVIFKILTTTNVG